MSDRRVGGADGRPIVSVYKDLRWVRPDERVRLSPDSALRLRAGGVTMVRIKLGWGKERELSLQHYLKQYGSARRQG